MIADHFWSDHEWLWLIDFGDHDQVWNFWNHTVPNLLKSMSSHQAESGESNQSLSRPHVNKSYLKFTDAAGKETDLTHEIQFGNLTCPCTVRRVVFKKIKCFLNGINVLFLDLLRITEQRPLRGLRNEEKKCQKIVDFRLFKVIITHSTK